MTVMYDSLETFNLLATTTSKANTNQHLHDEIISDLFKFISATNKNKKNMIYEKSSRQTHPSFKPSVQNVKYRVQRCILLHTLLSERYSRLMLFKDTGNV